ncbi:MAG TPA: hypothetical protein VFM43_05450 [Gaiellaceae bacterium]|nr:hypothetical protein [Gaiellaceae bacterium]
MSAATTITTTVATTTTATTTAAAGAPPTKTTAKNGTTTKWIGTRERRDDGSFVSTYSNADLYKLVALAARKARPDAPHSLSVRVFDQTLPAIGYPDAPSGRAIYARLKKPWPVIVERALSERSERSERQTEAVLKKREEAPWLTERHLYFALKAIAGFKEAETIPELSYEPWRAQYLANRVEETRQSVDLLEQLIPTAGQILRIAASLDAEGTTAWDKALAYAGLAPRPAATTVKGLPIVEAMQLYVEATGGEFWPSQDEVERLAKEWGIMIASRAGKNWSEYLNQYREARAAQGLEMPTTKLVRGTPKPIFGPKPEGLQAPERGNRNRWTDEEEAFRIVTDYVLDCRARGVTPSQRDYKDWQKGHRDRPADSTLVNNFGRTFTEWIRLVEERILEEKKAA